MLLLALLLQAGRCLELEQKAFVPEKTERAVARLQPSREKGRKDGWRQPQQQLGQAESWFERRCESRDRRFRVLVISCVCFPVGGKVSVPNGTNNNNNNNK